MKKIIGCLVFTILLFACKKVETSLQTNPDPSTASVEKSAGGSSPWVTTTYYAPDITYTTATAGGLIQSGNNGTTERGVCWSTSANPTTSGSHVANGTGAGTFTCSITGLTAGTTYYIKAYAIAKNKSTAYGNQLTFTTLYPYEIVPFGVTDIDGNSYTTIKIGTPSGSQTWMMENLKTTRYRDGITIPNVTGLAEWAALTTGAYCNYENNSANVYTYGRLYNWYAGTDAHNLAPEGWHVPTLADWTALETYLGGTVINGNYLIGIGRKLKEMGTEHWTSPNLADNVSGFTALPGGERIPYTNTNINNGFRVKDTSALFWSSSLNSSGWAYYRFLTYASQNISNPSSPSDIRAWGASIRCIKD